MCEIYASPPRRLSYNTSPSLCREADGVDDKVQQHCIKNVACNKSKIRAYHALLCITISVSYILHFPFSETCYFNIYKENEFYIQKAKTLHSFNFLNYNY